MHLFRRPSAFLPLLVTLVAALATSGRPAFASAPLLTSPRAGAELKAGSLATVEWENAPPDAEEWEAFLSLDGGRTYPMRITPHLDLSIRGFTFKVPAFPTRDARILLRFGDERREEIEVETPQRFAILPGLPGLSEGGSWLTSLKAAPSRGEPARPGDPGVVVWIEGARDGSGLREVLAEVATFSPSPRSLERSRRPWMPLLHPSRRHQTGLAASSLPADAIWTPLLQGPDTGSAARPPVLTSVRVLTGRLNI